MSDSGFPANEKHLNDLLENGRETDGEVGDIADTIGEILSADLEVAETSVREEDEGGPYWARFILNTDSDDESEIVEYDVFKTVYEDHEVLRHRFNLTRTNSAEKYRERIQNSLDEDHLELEAGPILIYREE